MLAFDLLGVNFADGMSRGRQVPFIDACRIRIKMHQPKGNRTAGGEVYRAVSGGGVKGKREGAGSLRIAAAQAVVK